MTTPTFKLLNYRNLIFEKLEYYNPHKTPKGSLVSTSGYRLSKNQSVSVFIETDKLKTTSGIIKVDGKFYIEFELDTESELYDFFMRFDDKNITAFHFNSRSWFGKQIPYDVAEEYYKSPIRLVRGKKNPVIRVKIPTHRGRILAEIFNNRKEQIDINKVSEGDNTISILEFVGLRFLKQQVIPEWELCKLKDLKDTSTYQIPQGYLFSDGTDPVSVNDDNNSGELEESSNLMADNSDNITSIDEDNLFNNENNENNEKSDSTNKNMEDFMDKLLEVEVDNFNKTDSKLDTSIDSKTENIQPVEENKNQENQDNQEPEQSVEEELDIEPEIIEEEDYESEFEIDADFSDLNHLNFPEYYQTHDDDDNKVTNNVDVNVNVDSDIDNKRKRLEDLRQKLTETKRMEEEMKLLETELGK